MILIFFQLCFRSVVVLCCLIIIGQASPAQQNGEDDVPTEDSIQQEEGLLDASEAQHQNSENETEENDDIKNDDGLQHEIAGPNMYLTDYVYDYDYPMYNLQDPLGFGDELETDATAGEENEDKGVQREISKREASDNQAIQRLLQASSQMSHTGKSGNQKIMQLGGGTYNPALSGSRYPQRTSPLLSAHSNLGHVMGTSRKAVMTSPMKFVIGGTGSRAQLLPGSGRRVISSTINPALTGKKIVIGRSGDRMMTLNPSGTRRTISSTLNPALFGGAYVVGGSSGNLLTSTLNPARIGGGYIIRGFGQRVLTSTLNPALGGKQFVIRTSGIGKAGGNFAFGNGNYMLGGSGQKVITSTLNPGFTNGNYLIRGSKRTGSREDVAKALYLMGFLSKMKNLHSGHSRGTGITTLVDGSSRTGSSSATGGISFNLHNRNPSRLLGPLMRYVAIQKTSPINHWGRFVQELGNENSSAAYGTLLSQIKYENRRQRLLMMKLKRLQEMVNDKSVCVNQ